MYAGRESVRHVAVCVWGLPPESPLGRADDLEASQWSLTNGLLAAAIDALRIANWQRGGGKAHERPDPIERPGVSNTNKIGGTGALPITDMDDWLGWSKN